LPAMARLQPRKRSKLHKVQPSSPRMIYLSLRRSAGKA
jgi:hypothetical protein